MTNVKFIKKENNYISLHVEGHTGYDVHGKDVLCSAISTIVQTGALGIMKVLKVKAKYSTEESRGYYKLELPVKLSDDKQEKCNLLFETMHAGLVDLQSGYSKFIKVEVEYVY